MLGVRVPERAPPTQKGIDGKVTAFREFTASSARFLPEDAGKEIEVYNSSQPQNNIIVVVAQVLSPSTVRTSPPFLPDKGPLHWELRRQVAARRDRVEIEVQEGDVSPILPGWIIYDGFGTFNVLGRKLGDERTLREGADGFFEVETAEDGSLRAYFNSPTGNFTYQDLGRRISTNYAEKPANNGYFQILSLVPPPSGTITRVRVSGAPVADTTPLFWAILERSRVILRGTAPTLRGVTEQRGEQAQLVVPPTGTFRGRWTRSVIYAPADLVEDVDVLDRHYLYVAIVPPDGSPPNVDLRPADSPLYWTLTDAQTVYLPGAHLTAEDAGKFVTFRIAGEVSRIRITSIVAEGTAVLRDAALALLPTGGRPPGASWEIRTPTGLEDFADVEFRAPPLINLLALDHGIEIDTQESEPRQRSWVKNVTQWIGMKGLDKSYTVIGRISGFEVTPAGLYRVSQAVADSVIPGDDEFEITEPGWQGTGTLWPVTVEDAGGHPTQVPGIYISNPKQAFRAGLEGLQLRIRGASTFSNNGRFTVLKTVDAQTLALAPNVGQSMNYPPPHGETVSWAILRIFTDLPPKIARPGDVAREDELAAAVMPNRYADSLYAWQEGYSTKVPVTITGTAEITPTLHEVHFYPAERYFKCRTDHTSGDVFAATRWASIDQPADPTTLPLWAPRTNYRQNDQVRYTPFYFLGQPGFWKLVDSQGSTFWVERVLQLLNWPWIWVRVYAAHAPAVDTGPGTAYFEYDPPVQSTEDYCTAARVTLLIEDGSIVSESGVQVESAMERAAIRMEDVTPKHVQVLPRYRRSFLAKIGPNPTDPFDAALSIMTWPERVPAGWYGARASVQELFRSENLVAPFWRPYDTDFGPADVATYYECIEDHTSAQTLDLPKWKLLSTTPPTSPAANWSPAVHYTVGTVVAFNYATDENWISATVSGRYGVRDLSGNVVWTDLGNARD